MTTSRTLPSRNRSARTNEALVPLGQTGSAGPLVILEAGKALAEAAGHTMAWLGERERTKAVRAAYRRDVKVARLELKAIQSRVNGAIRFWKSQAEDRKATRKQIIAASMQMIDVANDAIKSAGAVATTGNQESADRLVEFATVAMREAAQLIREKFPSGSPVTLEP